MVADLIEDTMACGRLRQMDTPLYELPRKRRRNKARKKCRPGLDTFRQFAKLI
jgi:hypothetical protein